MPAAVRVGDATIDQDNENNGPDQGKVIIGSPNVFINEGWGDGESEDVTGTALETPPPDGDLTPQKRSTESILGECAESYANRQPGIIEPSNTVDEPLKIRNVSVVADCNLNISDTFRLNEGTDKNPRPHDIVWTFKVNPDSDAKVLTEEGKPAGLEFNNTTGQLSGKVEEGTFSFTVTVSDTSGNVIDSKSYTVVAKKCDGTELLFTNPLPGSVRTSPYGPRKSSKSGMHWGVDLALPGNAIGKVVAAARGTVLFVSTNSSGYGTVFVIGHQDGNGKQVCCSVYGHCEKIYVQVGQHVEAGEPVALEGNRGHSSGAHLHFELRPANFCAGVGKTPNWFGVHAYDPWPYIQGKGKTVSKVKVTPPPIVQPVTTPTETPAPANPPSEHPSVPDSNLPECPAANIKGGPYATDQAYISYLAGLDRKHGLPNGTLYGVMMTETRGRPGLTSPTGAIGLFQQLGPFRQDMGMVREDSLDPYKAADAAGKYIKQIYRKNGGDLYNAVSGYNWGPGNAAKVRAANGNKAVMTSKWPDRTYADKVFGYMPNGCHVPASSTVHTVDNRGGDGDIPITQETMNDRCAGYVPPMTQTVDPEDPTVQATGGDHNSTEPAVAETRKGFNDDSFICPAPVQKKEAIGHIRGILNDVTNPITSGLNTAYKNFIEFQGKVASNFDCFAKDLLPSAGHGLFGMSTDVIGKYMLGASAALAFTGHPKAALFTGLTSLSLPTITNLLNYGVATVLPGQVPDINKINEIQTLAYTEYFNQNIKTPFEEFKNTAGSTINGLPVLQNEMTNRYKDLSPEAFMSMMQFEGMQNIRDGIDTGGLQFFNERYGK